MEGTNQQIRTGKEATKSYTTNIETLKANRRVENKCQPEHPLTNSDKIENPFNNLGHKWLQLSSKK